jgi:PAS domain-containing protein
MREQAALLDLASDAILVQDFSGKVRFWNKGAERLYGWSAARAIGNQIRPPFFPSRTTRPSRPPNRPCWPAASGPANCANTPKAARR